MPPLIPGRTGGARGMYPCAVAELIVAARSLDIGGVAEVIV